jgi:DNA-directed RNA polymerase subunit K/omega
LQKTFGDLGSKFKYVVVASKRAKQLLKGAKPKLKTKSKSLIRIAQEEVKDGFIDFEIVPKKKEEEHVVEEEDFIGEDIVGEVEAIKKEIKKKSEKEKKKPAPKKKGAK